MAGTQQTSSPFSFIYYLFLGFLPVISISTILDHSLLPRQFYSSLALLVILVFAFFNRGRVRASVAAPVWSWLAFIIINIIAISAAINPVESLATISRYALGLGFLATTIVLLRSKLITMETLARGGAIFATTTGIMTLFEILKLANGGDFIANIYEIRGTFSHKNLLSSALMLGFPFVVMSTIILSKSWRRYSIFLALLLIVEMFLLRTRGVWLSMFISSGVAFFTLLIVRKRFKLQLKRITAWVGGGALLALAVLLIFFGTTDLGQRLTNRSNLDQRLAFWQNTTEMVADHPLLGVGPGNWKINFPKYGLVTREGREYQMDWQVYQGIVQIQRPHNDFLWVLSEGGILALVFFVGIFVMAFVQVAGNLRKVTSREALAVEIATLMGLLAYLGFSFTDFPLERSEHMVLLCCLLALPFRDKIHSKSEVPTLAFIVGMSLLSAFSILVSYERINGERESVKVLEANRSRNAIKIIDHSQAAKNEFYNMDNYANPLDYYLSLGRSAQGKAEPALVAAKAAYDIHPYNVIVLNQLGNVYRMQGQNKEALKYYEEATSISINMEAAQLSRAELYLQEQEYAKAMEALNFVRVDPRNQRYVQLLGKVVPAVVSRKNQHQRFQNMIRKVEQQQPKSARDYAAAYIRFRQAAI